MRQLTFPINRHVWLVCCHCDHPRYIHPPFEHASGFCLSIWCVFFCLFLSIWCVCVGVSIQSCSTFSWSCRFRSHVPLSLRLIHHTLVHALPCRANFMSNTDRTHDALKQCMLVDAKYPDCTHVMHEAIFHKTATAADVARIKPRSAYEAQVCSTQQAANNAHNMGQER